MKLFEKFCIPILIAMLLNFIAIRGNLFASALAGDLPNRYCPVTTDEKAEPDIWTE